MTNNFTATIHKINSWLQHSVTGLPSSLITDVSFVVPISDENTDRPAIALAACSVDEGVLSVVFVDINTDTQIATGEYTSSGVFPLSCKDCSGTISIGHIPTTDYKYAGSALPVSASRVTPVPQISKDKSELVVVVLRKTDEGEIEYVDGKSFEESVYIIPEYPVTGTVQLQDGKQAYVVTSEPESPQATGYTLKRINSVCANSDGEITVTLATDNIELFEQLTLTKHSPSDQTDIRVPTVYLGTDNRVADVLKYEDIFDKYLKPTKNRALKYLPIDDAYTTEAADDDIEYWYRDYRKIPEKWINTVDPKFDEQPDTIYDDSEDEDL